MAKLDESRNNMPSWMSAPVVEEDREKNGKETVPAWAAAPVVEEGANQTGRPLADYELQAADVISRQVGGMSSPTVAGGVLASGARAISGAYRLGELLPEKWGGKHSRERADWFANYSSALIKAAGIAGEQGVVKRGATQALSNAVPMLAGGPLGAPAMIGIGVADQMNVAVTEGRNAGLKGAELGAYVGRQGLIEGTVTGLMQKVGIGGMERVLPGAFSAARNGIRQGLNQALKTGLKTAAKQTARTFGEEAIEENTIQALQMWNDKYSGVDKSDWSLDQVARSFADVTAAVVWTTLGGAGPVHLAENVKAGKLAQTEHDIITTAWTTLGGAGPVHLAENVKAGKLAQTEHDIITTAAGGRTPTRKQWKDWGLDPAQGKTAQSRQEAVQRAAQQLQQQYPPTEPVAGQTQQATPETVINEESISDAERLNRGYLAAVEEASGEVGGRPVPSVEIPSSETITQAHMEVPTGDSVQAAAEPIQQGPETASPITSVKNQIVTELRKERGELAVPGVASETVVEWLNAAEQQLKSDPTFATRMVKELNQQPRTISDTDTAALQLHYRDLNNQFSTASDEVTAARQSNDPLAIKESEAKAQFLLGEVQQTENAAKAAGREWGRAGVARQIELREDYSPATLVRRASVAKGKLLSEAETNQINELSTKVTILQNELDNLNTARSEQDADSAVDAAIKQAIPKKRFQKQVPTLKKIEAQKHVQDAWAEFKRTLGPPAESLISGESGALNVDAVTAGIKLAKAYADLGVVTFTEFLTSARTFMGDVAGVTTDTLRQSWEQAIVAGYIPKLTIDPTDAKTITRTAKRLTRSMVENGITDRDAVVDGVHAELQQAIPDITKRQVMDAISGYGQYAELTKGEVESTIRDIKGQLQQLSKLEDMQKGQPPKKTGVERRTPSDDERRLIRQVNEAKRRGGFNVTDPATQLKSAKTRLQTRLSDLQRRIAEKDFTKVTRKETPLDKEAADLKWQVKQEQDRYNAMEEGWRKEQLRGISKAWDTAAETANFSRAMMTSFDLSAAGRQAGPAALAHPAQAAFALEESLKAFASKEGEFASAERSRNNPKAPLANAAKLAITVTEGQLTQQEEAYRGKWASKVYGVAGSERAYVTFLNTMRMGMFSEMVDSLGGIDNVTLDEAKVIANCVNVFTGRGYFTGANAAAAQALSTYFFSPRFVVSRFQLLLLQPLWHGNARTRKLVAKEYARYLVGNAAFYSMLGLLGYLTAGTDDKDKPVFEWNPLSPNFGKVRFGDTVIDPMSGLSQVTVLTSRLVLGKTKKSTGEIVPIRGEGVPLKGLTTTDVIGRFLRSKLAPIPGAAWNVLAGENMIGEEKSPLLEAVQLIAPLSFRDIYDTMRTKGFSRKMTLSLLVVLGVGAQNYQDATPESFARKISAHPQLRGYDKKEKRYYDYSTEVDQIVREAKRRGLKASDLGQVLVPYMQKEGNKPETINSAVARLYARFNASE
jgi:hypothetical protein